jgi:hypothetical protein
MEEKLARRGWNSNNWKYIFIIIVILFCSCLKNKENSDKNVSVLQKETIEMNLDDFEIEENVIEDNFIEDLSIVSVMDIEYPYNIGNGFFHIPLIEEDIRIMTNIYDQPNQNSNIICKLYQNEIIEVIENTEIVETINNIMHYWYKIKYIDVNDNEVIGHILGGDIIKSTIFDDEDSIEIFYYSKISYMERRQTSDTTYAYFSVILPKDIYIYINNKRISNNTIENFYNEQKYNDNIRYRGYCYFKPREGYIELNIHEMIDGEIFRVYPNGNIIMNGW